MFTHRIDDDLELRLPEERDAEDLSALIETNRVYLREWMHWLNSSNTIEAQRERIRKNRLLYAEGTSLMLHIWRQGSLVGTIGAKNIDQTNKKTEFGYWLDEKSQGKGIITRSCEALLNHCFDSLGLNRVEIHCQVENRQSRRIPERLGFTEEGVLRQNLWHYDHFIDTVVYALLVDDWRKHDEGKKMAQSSSS
ncbi:MAG: GNAT family N-acetyltransferase [Planctomycetes bacterium]|nr:GNAT family N-acetyltransferase [Planctomycetota bacterium]NUQ34493.1 GNAT family N-acetyltransferase [Planctomycetaceae bacterium]